MSPKARSKFFDHTADIGLEVEAPDLPSLFLEAGRAMLGWLGDFVPACASAEPEKTVFEGGDDADLLVDWLGEVLYRAQHVGRIPGSGALLEFDGPRLVARVRWIPIDEKASRIDRELKAATYHRLQVGPRPGGGYRATVVFDV